MTKKNASQALGPRARIEAGAVQRRGGTKILVHAGDVVLRARRAEAAVEPQLVLGQRTAKRRVDVPDLLDAVDADEADLLQVVAEVVALEAAVREVAEERAAAAL